MASDVDLANGCDNCYDGGAGDRKPWGWCDRLIGDDDRVLQPSDSFRGHLERMIIFVIDLACVKEKSRVLHALGEKDPQS